MPKIETTVSTPIHESFRTAQVAGMFDLPPENVQRETFAVEVPSPAEPWQIGAIVGPSGSGKSTIAQAAFGDLVHREGNWQPQAAIVDQLGELPIKQITGTLTAVGLGSPPAWLRPFATLSTGEQFRAELARSLLFGGIRNADCGIDKATVPQLPVVFDEFTSTVDRTVARVASAAVARAIRRGQIPARLVAVTCHRDVLPWLEPDWVVDMSDRTLTRYADNCGLRNSDGGFNDAVRSQEEDSTYPQSEIRNRPSNARRRLRRPQIRLRVFHCRPAAWSLFARHHYLSGRLSRASKCYLATWDDRPVGFCAVVALYGHKRRRRIHRLVVLPDFQGIGIGGRLLNAVAKHEQAEDRRVNITTSHPAVIGFCDRDDAWRTVTVRGAGISGRQTKAGKTIKASRGRATVSFEFT